MSRGYYCSLLAEARQHRVLPSVSTINDLRENLVGLNVDLLPLIDGTQGDDACVSGLVFFGNTYSDDAQLKKLGKEIFRRYPAPILFFSISGTSSDKKVKIERFSFSQLNVEQRHGFMHQLTLFTSRVWKNSKAKQRLRWDMTILINPDEKHPPSDKEAIKRFVKAAAKVGIYASTITPEQSDQISQYDALFIRETTAIDHHTYRLARKAERDGLVVIDDCQSILRCCNKVFLHDAFSYHNIPALPTYNIISQQEHELDKIEKNLGYPLVLKLPEGAFSKGVFKVNNRQELNQKVSELLSDTAVLLAQQFLFTEYDWRIGVLNGRAIYACRYFMARNHWQIYNHGAKRGTSGGFETLPTFEVPKVVLDAAVRSSLMIGKGLYGVDIKHHGKQVYVIEVNDNPSIDHGVEDKYLGDELYMQIMSEFVARLERRGR